MKANELMKLREMTDTELVVIDETCELSALEAHLETLDLLSRLKK